MGLGLEASATVSAHDLRAACIRCVQFHECSAGLQVLEVCAGCASSRAFVTLYASHHWWAPAQATVTVSSDNKLTVGFLVGTSRTLDLTESLRSTSALLGGGAEGC